MKTLTEKELQDMIDVKTTQTLFFHTDSDLRTKSIDYDFLSKNYTIYTKNGTISTMCPKEAIHRYNTEDLTLREVVSLARDDEVKKEFPLGSLRVDERR